MHIFLNENEKCAEDLLTTFVIQTKKGRRDCHRHYTILNNKSKRTILLVRSEGGFFVLS